ncbi:MAG: hypothetical protein FJ221_12560 [Lentisphaerae bacterium]|nr:hypothetical protein [Lentisphaerota bacterium]
MKTREPDELDSLIDRHLDGLLDDAGRARLDGLLRASPDAALRFARAVRMDERLYRHFHRRQALDLARSRLVASDVPRVVRLTRPEWLRRAREHAWGPAAAIALHAALLLILIRWVVVTPPPTTGDGVEITLADRPDGAPLDRRPVLPEDPGGLTLRVPGPSIAGPPPAEIEPPGVADLRVAFLPLDANTAAAVADPSRLAHPLVAGRFGAERARRAALHGGPWSAAADRTTSNAAAWLASTQSADGAWHEEGSEDEALTSLVLLALMGRGETPVHGAHRAAVRSALQHLATQRPEALSPRTAALRLCALADAVALTRLPALLTLLDGAVAAALDAERPGGGWAGRAPAADPLVTAWTVEALRIASASGIDDPRLAPALLRAAGALDATANPTSGLLYYPAPERQGPLAQAETAASLLALQLAGEASGARLQRGLRALDAMSPSWPGADQPAAAVEALYFATRARFNEGGGGWMKWMAGLAPAIVDSVRTGELRSGAHPIRTTALAVLILEMPSRYPPASRWPVAAGIPALETFLAMTRPGRTPQVSPAL